MTAKLYLIELPIYLGTLWWLLSTSGIKGAAIACLLRVSLDTLILFAMAYRFIPDTLNSISRLGVMLGGALLVLVLCTVPTNLLSRVVLLFLMLVIFTLVAWFLIFEPEERHLFKGKLRPLPFLNG